MSNYYDDATDGDWILDGADWNIMSAKIVAAATLTGTETLTNKTLTSPVISAISNSGTLTLPSGTDTVVARATADTLTNKTLTNPTLGNSNLLAIKQAIFNGVVNDGDSGTSKDIDWSAGSLHKLTLTGNCTLTFTPPTGPSRLTAIFLQDTSGSRTVTWPTVKWAGAAAPTLTTTASRADIITFVYDGTSYYGVASLNFN